MPAMVNPDRLFCAVNHNLFKIFVFKKYFDIAQSYVLLQNVAYEHVYSLFVCSRKIFADEDEYAFLKLVLYVRYFRHALAFKHSCALRYKLFPYFLKNYFCGLAYVCDRDAVNWDRLVVI